MNFIYTFLRYNIIRLDTDKERIIELKEKPEEKCARRKVRANCRTCAACVLGKGPRVTLTGNLASIGFFCPREIQVYSFSDF